MYRSKQCSILLTSPTPFTRRGLAIELKRKLDAITQKLDFDASRYNSTRIIGLMRLIGKNDWILCTDAI